MEITNEIKAKVFAQYLGHICRYDMEGRPFRGTDKNELLTTENLALLCFSNHRKMVLKPLSAITDEDAIYLAKVVYPDWKTRFDDSFNFSGIGRDIVCATYKGRYSEIKLNYAQFLQSRGYDLPQYLLDGKTLHEAGLAIYE